MARRLNNSQSNRAETAPSATARGASTRGAVLQLMSAYGGGSFPVAALLRGVALLGYRENAARVALARLKADGRIESVEGERGVYRLGRSAHAVHQQVAAWRDVERRVCGWDGGWIAAHTAALGRSDRAALRKRQRALRFYGLRELSDGLLVRPRNLEGGVAEVAARLRELGVPARALLFGIDELDGEQDARARALWQADGLDRRYAKALRVLAESSERIAAGDIAFEAAAREAFEIGGAAIHLIVFDPLLPEPIVDASARRELIEASVAYDKLGRELWNRVLLG